MQYHYVVVFDDETNSWGVLDDTEGYLPDGNVWDEGVEYGWFWPDGDIYPRESAIDQRCFTMLTTLASIWPAVDTHDY